jgi:hypothetical protein
MPDQRPVRRTERLNWLGRAVVVGGGAIRLAANAIDGVIKHAADVVIDAERAFKQGLDPNIEDAKVLEERTDSESG